MYIHCMISMCVCMSLHENADRVKFGSQQMSDRPIVASAATGSLSSLIFWLLTEGLHSSSPTPPPHFLDCPVCADWELPKLDFWCGIFCGLAIWPLLELLVLCKQWLTLTLRNRIASVAAGGGKLYRVLE